MAVLLMKPLGNRVLCREIATEETLPGGRVLLLESSRESATEQQAEVIAVGPGGVDEDGDVIPMDPRLVEGAWILHKTFARTYANDSKTEFFIKAEDIVAILESS